MLLLGSLITIFFWLTIFYLFFRLITGKSSFQTLVKPDYPIFYHPHLIWSLLLLVIAFNIFIYSTNTHYLPTVGLAGFNLLILLGIWLVTPKAKRSLFYYSLLIASAIAGIALPLRANGFVQAVNLTLMYFSWLLIIFTLIQDRIHWEGLWIAKNSLRLIPKYIGHCLSFIIKPNPEVSDLPAKKSLVTQAVKIIVITCVLLLLFGSLLVQADPVFQHLTQNLIDELVPRTIASLFLVIAAIVIVTLRLKSYPQNRFNLSILSPNDLLIPTTAVVILFGAFIAIQAKYLFANEAAFQALEISYSLYVRKGFTELLAASFLGGLLAYLIILKHRELPPLSGSKKSLIVITSMLLIELFCLLLSALKRDLMYVDAYGLTRVRVVGVMFLVWLAIFLLLILALNMLKDFQEKRFFTGIWLSSLSVWLLINLVNIDALVAQGAPGHHQFTDHFYLTNLSEDAFFAWDRSIPELEQSVARLTSLQSLTDEQKSELATTKLALISLQEQRIDLLKKYAPNDWLLDHYDAIYDEHCDTCKTAYSFASVAMRPEEGPEMAGAVKRVDQAKADWRSYNLPEYRAFEQVLAQPEKYQAQVNLLIQSILDFQELNQVDLYEQENRLLKEFTYPFITIALKYYPRPLSSYKFTHSASYSDELPENLQAILKANHPTLADIAALPPETEPATYNLVLMVRSSYDSPESNDPYVSFITWDLSADRLFSLYAPKDLASTQKLVSLTSGVAVPIQVKIQPFSSTYNDEKGDTPIEIHGYQITDWQEIKLLN